MLPRTLCAGLLCWLACAGCSRQKATDELIADVKAPAERERLIAVRLLAQRQGDAPQVIPALIDALKDQAADIRQSAAIGLGYFGEPARDAVPALQAVQRDPDARVREAAAVALSRIDPARFPPRPKGRAGR